MTGPPIPFQTSRTIRDGVAVDTTRTVQETHDGYRFTYEVPADGRADRSDLIAALVGSVVLLAEVKSPIGSAYRQDLVARIRSIIEREHHALGVL